ncbi:MAG: HAMP domain-containing sensor histidine kinase [Acidobacteriota bacterium]|nr:HAMP domain-containing sensor histidine kinase [Acidobacteriota bacterium]
MNIRPQPGSEQSPWSWILSDRTFQLVAVLVLLDVVISLSGVLSDDVLWFLNSLLYSIHTGWTMLVIRYSLWRQPGPDQEFWNLVSLAFLCWWIVPSVELVFPWFFQSALGWPAYDALMLLFYFLLISAVELRPDWGGRSDPEYRLELLGSGIFLFAMLAYFTVIPAVYSQPSEGLRFWLSSPLYVIMDLYLVVRLLWVRRGAGGTRWAPIYTCMIVAAVLWALTDSYDILTTFPYLPLDAEFGPQWLFLWRLAIPAFIVSVRFRGYSPRQPPAPAHPWDRHHRSLISRLLVLALLLPIIHLIVQFTTPSAEEGLRHARELVATVGLLALLGMALHQYRRLADHNRALLTEQVRISEQLKLAERDLRRFLFSFSHDLRSPLVNLRGFAGELRLATDSLVQLLQGSKVQLAEAQSLLEDDIHEAVEMIDSSSEQMDRYVTALLQLARAGHREFVTETVDLETICAQALADLKFEIQRREVQVSVGSLPTAAVDRLAMTQIFANLLTNAVQYLDPDRPGRIQITGETSAGKVKLRICDNGRGIPAHELSEIFLPFRRGGNHKAPGEGIGLAHVRLLVRRLGGRIHCESTEGVGSCFEVLLPSGESDPPESGNERPSRA